MPHLPQPIVEYKNREIHCLLRIKKIFNIQNIMYGLTLISLLIEVSFTHFISKDFADFCNFIFRIYFS